MKKLITIILALAMLLPAVALADLPDVTGMTDQELHDMISACSAELMARNTSEPDGTLLFEFDGVKLYQKGEPYKSSSYLYIPVAIYSSKDFQLTLSLRNAKINGWEVYSSGITVDANAKKKGELCFDLSDADISGVEQIESLVFSWVVFNQDTWDTPYEGEEEEHRFW